MGDNPYLLPRTPVDSSRDDLPPWRDDGADYTVHFDLDRLKASLEFYEQYVYRYLFCLRPVQ